MKGNSEIKITGPRNFLAALFTAKAMAKPVTNTKGKVISVKVRVKRKAFQKSIFCNSVQLRLAKAAAALGISRTLA